MITWIRDEIAIGDSQDAISADNKIFDATLNVAIDLDIKDEFKWRYKIGLLDGPGNDPRIFAAILILLDSLVSQDKKVLVHCHAGASRSVMVVAAWLKYKGYTSLDEALGMIMPYRKIDQYRPALKETAREALKWMGIVTV
jgi:protein-tyrosine phosphatase